MLRIYFKQAWTLMRQHRLFTTIYVIGTGLSIALTMTLFIILFVKFAPIYPEYNRNETMVIGGVKRSPKGNPKSWSINAGISYLFIRDVLSTLKHAEAVAGVLQEPTGFEAMKITLPNREMMDVAATYVDADFWKVFTFNFLKGIPFTKEEVDGKVPVVVISESTAKHIFASTDVVGEKIVFNGKEFRVCGVVEDVSMATKATSGDCWFPIYETSWIQQDLLEGSQSLIGSTKCYILFRSGDEEALKKEVEEVVKQHNLQNDTFEHDLLGQPYVYWQSVLRGGSHKPLDLWESLKTYLYMLLALLFIPALNLSGMISSRMDGRLSELGVRKAYGATNRRLIGQVLGENLLLTFLGGLLGLLVSYLIVYTSSDWILYIFDDFIDNTMGVDLKPEMLFSPTLFALAFGLCILLNLVSALIPAVIALKKSIINSIHSKL